MKKPKITMHIDDVSVCTGRLIGIIDNNTCRAIINTPEAGKKIYTTEAMDVDDLKGNYPGMRFVVATDDLIPDKHERLVFISPAIRYMSYIRHNRNFRCEDNREYAIKRTQLI